MVVAKRASIWVTNQSMHPLLRITGWIIQTPLLFRAEPVGDLLGDHEGVAAGAVVDKS
jgi:hypothetical protein